MTVLLFVSGLNWSSSLSYLDAASVKTVPVDLFDASQNPDSNEDMMEQTGEIKLDDDIRHRALMLQNLPDLLYIEECVMLFKQVCRQLFLSVQWLSSVLSFHLYKLYLHLFLSCC